jgi:hypothetical protein
MAGQLLHELLSDSRSKACGTAQLLPQLGLTYMGLHSMALSRAITEAVSCPFFIAL